MFCHKVVLITGASLGIGSHTSVEFARQGARLVITGLGKDDLCKTAQMCVEMSPCRYQPVCIPDADVSKEADIENIMKQTISCYQQLDVLVNNAGIMPTGSIENTSVQQYDSIFNVNVRGPYYLTMLAVPHLIKTKGNIVNMSSVAGLRSFPNLLAYCMSKACIDQFTRCLALELGDRGVRVNAVCPGVIDTGLHLRGGMSKEDYAKYLIKCKETHALRRIGTVQEVSNTILFLASECASNITGASVPVDGGRHAMCPR